MSLRVVHVFATMHRGGAELRTLELLGHVSPPWDVSVCCLVHADGGLGLLFENAGAPVSVVRARSVLFPWRSWLAFRGAQVVHTHINILGALVLPVAWAAGVPVRIVHFRSDGSALGSGWRDRVLERVLRGLIRVFATDVVGVSPGALTHGWSADWQSDRRCRVVLPGLETTGLDEVEPADLGDGPVVVHVGREVPVKNRPFAVEVLAELRNLVPDVRLVFVGRDDVALRGQTEDLVRKTGVEGAVEWLGERDDVASILRRADVLLLTSVHEGLPGVVLEARANGTPVVATRLPGTEYIRERLERVSLHDLAESPAVWAESVARVLAEGTQPSERELALRDFRDSPFDMQQAARAFQNLWVGHRG